MIAFCCVGTALITVNADSERIYRSSGALVGWRLSKTHAVQ